MRSLHQWSQGSVSKSADHTASRGSSQKASVSKGSHAHSEVRSLSTVIASPLKIRVFTQRLIRLSSFHSLSGILGSPLLSLSSSRVILIFDTFVLQLSLNLGFVVPWCMLTMITDFSWSLKHDLAQTGLLACYHQKTREGCG